jgi:hypothetical protein
MLQPILAIHRGTVLYILKGTEVFANLKVYTSSATSIYAYTYFQLTALVTYIRLIIIHVQSTDSGHLHQVPLHKGTIGLHSPNKYNFA